MKITIRKARKDELKRIVDVTNKAYNIPFDSNGPKHKYKEPYNNLIERFLKKEVGVFVACYDGKIIGAQRYEFLDDASIHLFKLAVLKKFRNLGIAPRLIQRAESEAKKKGCVRSRLDCMREKGLVPYYQKLGFTIDKTKKHLDHYDVYMSKIL